MDWILTTYDQNEFTPKSETLYVELFRVKMRDR